MGISIPKAPRGWFITHNRRPIPGHASSGLLYSAIPTLFTMSYFYLITYVPLSSVLNDQSEWSYLSAGSWELSRWKNRKPGLVYLVVSRGRTGQYGELVRRYMKESRLHGNPFVWRMLDDASLPRQSGYRCAMLSRVRAGILTSSIPTVYQGTTTLLGRLLMGWVSSWSRGTFCLGFPKLPHPRLRFRWHFRALRRCPWLVEKLFWMFLGILHVFSCRCSSLKRGSTCCHGRGVGAL